MKVLLITGGDSSERKISLKSAKNVEEALRQNGHEIFVYDLRLGYEPIREISKNFNIFFPVLHGEEGEGGRLHKFLTELDKPIVGTRNYKGLQEAWYKIPFKKYCDVHNIPTAPWKIVESEKDIVGFGFPCVLKASNGGSSKEVVILKSQTDLGNDEARKILVMDNIFVEKAISGTELTVGTLNDEVLPIIEIVPTKHTWFSFDAKYDNSTEEIPFAPSVNESTQQKLKSVTKRIRNEFDLGSYMRVDYMVRDGEVYALDVNTIVGLTSGSLYPKMGEAFGLKLKDLLQNLLESAK